MTEVTSSPPLAARIFGAVLLLLVLSFFFVPDIIHRNWLLYLAGVSAHALLGIGWRLSDAFGRPGGWAILALTLAPLASVLWSNEPTLADFVELSVTAYCILAVYFGISYLCRHDQTPIERLTPAMVAAANVGALLSIGHWLATRTPEEARRLTGWLGLDNPVHGSILILAATLPVLQRIANGGLRPVWLAACALPWIYAVLASPRMALLMYVVVAGYVLRRHWKLLAIAGIAAVVLTAVVVLTNDDAATSWIRRGLSFRDQIWQVTLAQYAKCSALFGCGLTTPLSIEVTHNIASRAHSIYIAALYHQGMVGLVLFVGCALSLLRVPPGEPRSTPDLHAVWAPMFALALLANLASGDHLLVRASLFWAYFWLPAMVLAGHANSTRLGNGVATARPRPGAN